MSRKIGFLVLSLALVGFVSVTSVESARIMDNPIDVNAAINLGPEVSGSHFGPSPLSDCDISRDNCGSVTPSSVSVFIGDGAYNWDDMTLFFMDIPSGSDGIFQVDPATCSVISGTYYGVNGGLSQRGIGYDWVEDQVWCGGWNDGLINQHDATPPYTQIASNSTGLSTAGIAVDYWNRYLFILTNSYPDYLYVYDISGGSLGSMLGVWSLPWQTSSDGYDAGGLAFDDDSGNLVAVNQYGYGYGLPNAREEFSFTLGGGPVGAGSCDMANTTFAWGIAVIEDGDPAPTSFIGYTHDIAGFAPPFDLDEYGIPAVYPPFDLVCDVTGDNDVDMSWTNGGTYDSVNVYRDGGLLATLPGDATTYLDIAPGIGPHTYGVSGVVGSDESGQAQCSITIYPSGVATFDFNASDGGFVAGGYADWEWGTPSYNIDGNAWETNLGMNYFNNSCGWLDTPGINLGPEGGFLVFEFYEYIESYYDGWNTQISLDGGMSWSMIYPVTGYDQGVPYGACDEGLGGDTWYGYGDMGVREFDLTGYPNTTVMIRWLFESDSSVAYSGPILDNVCMFGGTVPSVMVQCQLLNADMDGDGSRDVHVGEAMYYCATFINLTGDPVEYGAAHYFYAGQSCPNPDGPIDKFGPACKGTVEANGIATHYYMVMVPDNDNLLDWNPFCVQVAAYECDGGVPVEETGRCCFDVCLLPAWEPPPVPEPIQGFVVQEIDAPPMTR
jgi:hypothetical protein